MTQRPLTRARRLALGLLAAAAPLAPLACDDPTALLDDAAPETAYIRGVVTAREPGRDAVRLLVDGESPNPAHPIDRAWVTVGPSTAVTRADGRPASASDVQTGATVTVWATGAELRSYPVQVTAALVVLDR